MAVDLHIHSTISDGTLTPQQIVQVAQEKGLTAIAIADHDVVAGVEPAMQAARGSRLRVIPAVEISTEHHGAEIHLLGYFIDIESPGLLEKLHNIREARRRRARQIVQKLNKLGVGITVEDVAAQAGQGSTGRPHIAAALVKAGYVSSSQEAFARYLTPGRPAYVPRYRLSPSEAVQTITQAGGLAVLAHPSIDNAEKYIDELQEEGLGGLEAYHTHHTDAQTRRFLELADELRLLVTGGTDSHGPRGPSPVEMGSVPVPDEYAAGLLAWAKEHQRAQAKSR